MNDVSTGPLGYGLIGAGAFGRFCVEQYRELPGMDCRAVADAHPAAAQHAADTLGLTFCSTVEDLLSRDDIAIVHLATPPRTHADLAVQALRAGKHVLCEKPLAITTSDAQRIAQAAREADRRVTVNLIMRYNPLAEAVQAIVAEGLLGEPIHGMFLNEAKDQDLGPDHWFWDQGQSGGIFIEHGVHFFDLLDYWLGPKRRGEVLAAHRIRRPGQPRVTEQVQAQLRYGEDMLFTFLHAFTQANRMDRQELRLVFENGEIRLHEWVATRLELDGLVREVELARLKTLLPNHRVQDPQRLPGLERHYTSRHRAREADLHLRLQAEVGMDKPALYGHMLRALMRDLMQAIHDPNHRPRVTIENGLRSLDTADRATRLAAQG